MYCNIKTLIRAEGNVVVVIQMGESNTPKETMMGV